MFLLNYLIKTLILNFKPLKSPTAKPITLTISIPNLCVYSFLYSLLHDFLILQLWKKKKKEIKAQLFLFNLLLLYVLVGQFRFCYSSKVHPSNSLLERRKSRATIRSRWIILKSLCWMLKPQIQYWDQRTPLDRRLRWAKVWKICSLAIQSHLLRYDSANCLR